MRPAGHLLVANGTLTAARMELALAELVIEEPQDPEEDIDFVVDKGTFFPHSHHISSGLSDFDAVEEEDVFESDFASTDEEAAREDVDEEDRATREEERRERKVRAAFPFFVASRTRHDPPLSHLFLLRPHARASKKPPRQPTHASG